MQIDKIENFPTFKKVRKNWDYVYAADTHAHFFLSWVLLSGLLPMVHEPWLILAAKPDTHEPSDYVAFFPLKLTLKKQHGGGFAPQLCMAGNSLDYTGIICLPEYEEEVIPAFATYIQQQLVWSSFELKNILETDTRMALFLRSFSRDSFDFSQIRIHNEGEDTDNYIAPYVSLPDDWNQYLQNYVSSNTRQKIRRFFRKIETSDEFYLTQVDADNLQSHIEILLKFWESRWRKQKGNECDVIINSVRAICLHCFKHNCLYLPVLWQGDRPLGAIANFVDVERKSMLFVITGRDRSWNNPPPGLILHAEAIRYAIKNGFKVYDFLRGNEEYKYSFGPKERHIQHIVVKYKNPQKKPLDVRTLPLAFNLTVKEHQANQITKAEQGYRQILEVDSNHPEALYGLGVLMRQKGNYQTAENLLKNLLQVQPNSIKALFSLGNLYQTQGQSSQAIEAYNQVLTLEPDAIAAYNNLGYALQQQGKWEQAIACYQKALKVKPNCVEADVNLGNALHAQGKLSPDKQAHYAQLNYKLGLARTKAGDLQTAEVYLQKALELNPNCGEVYKSLAEIYKRQQNFKDAEAAY
ncbi:MAG: GNAT family N-acetyltransferase [Moorea sp. SIO2B7]|nr:GNAT family N-acetyltransferase [Moorena sp. SIO2B7]